MQISPSDIWTSIGEARFLIADLTGRNANVFYELGLAHARNKSVILLTQNSADVPFDLRELRYIRYNPNDPAELRQSLISFIKSQISTIPSRWHPTHRPAGEVGPYIKITFLHARTTISLDQQFEITLKARNNGKDTQQGYFSVSFPTTVDNLRIESNIETRIGLKGDFWGNRTWVLDCPIAEGFLYAHKPIWISGKEYYIKVRGQARRRGLLWFYVSASCWNDTSGQWAYDPPGPTDDVDQRGEHVYCGVVEVV